MILAAVCGAVACSVAALVAPLLTGGVQAQSAATGRVRVAHMVPNASSIDVLIDGKVTFSNVAFKQISPYAALPAGNHQVVLAAAGQDSTPLFSTTASITGGADATFVAVGTPTNMQLVALADDNSAPPAGQVKVRVFHASPDVGGADISVANGPVLAQNLAFTSVSPYITVPAGTYDLQVKKTGTSTVLLNIPNIVLPAGQTATVFATGLAADNSMTSVPVMDAMNGQVASPMAAAGGSARVNGPNIAAGTPAAATPVARPAAAVTPSAVSRGTTVGTPQGLPASGTAGLVGSASLQTAWLVAALGVLALSLGVGAYILLDSRAHK